MKKIVSVVLVLAMIISMCATASAATVSELINTYLSPSAENVILDFNGESALEISVKARKNASDTYSVSPLNIVDSNLSSGVGVGFTATLNMQPLRDVFNGIFYGLAKDATDFAAGTVDTEITVTIDYPGAVVADTTVGSLTNNNGIFQQDGDRILVDSDTLQIKFNNDANGTLTAATLAADVATYLADLTFTLPDGAVVYNTEGSHKVTVTLEGSTTLTFDSTNVIEKNPIIKYNGSTEYIVNTDIPSSGGGGSSSLTIKLETNGGNELKNISVRRGGKVSELPVPVREGYVFTGWYTDSALTNPFDTDTVINRNYTLYAKWVESGECEGTVEDNCPCLKYDDLDPTMWYHKGVDYVLNRGMMIGVDTTQFAPDWDVTRAMLVTVLWRAEGKPAGANTTFTDLEDGQYYVDAVNWAAANGVVNGYSDTVFAPNDAITREQFAAIMYRYAKNKGYDVSVGENTNILSYSDYDAISEYAIEAMQYTLGSGLIKGRTETTLNPKDNTTRAEMATILYRFFTEIK